MVEHFPFYITESVQIDVLQRYGKSGLGVGTYFLLALLCDLAQEITSAPGHL